MSHPISCVVPAKVTEGLILIALEPGLPQELPKKTAPWLKLVWCGPVGTVERKTNGSRDSNATILSRRRNVL